MTVGTFLMWVVMIILAIPLIEIATALFLLCVGAIIAIKVFLIFLVVKFIKMCWEA